MSGQMSREEFHAMQADIPNSRAQLVIMAPTTTTLIPRRQGRGQFQYQCNKTIDRSIR
jgi:hypothetical protein